MRMLLANEEINIFCDWKLSVTFGKSLIVALGGDADELAVTADYLSTAWSFFAT